MLYRWIALVLVGAGTIPLWTGRPVLAAADDEIGKLIARINAAGPEGAGNQDAANAWKDLVARGADALLPTVAALGDAGPRAANWLRPAIDAIVEREHRAGRKLPLDRLEQFVKDVKNLPVSRRAAYELLASEDKQTPDRLLPGMIDDPSIDLRRDAIAAAIEKAAPHVKEAPDTAKAELRKLFGSVRDQDQAEKVAKLLGELGEDVDLTTHFGFITKWMVVGPFDSTDGAGFGKPFDPERAVDLSASYTGKDGKALKWSSYWTFDTLGSVDLNEALGKHKHAAAYAFAALDSPAERPAEVRVGSIGGVEVFLNGKRVFAREEYHHGQRMDQYVGLGTLKKGRNEVLVKVLQNNQTEPWAQEWSFQARLCDATGGALPLKLLTAN